MVPLLVVKLALTTYGRCAETMMQQVFGLENIGYGRYKYLHVMQLSEGVSE